MSETKISVEGPKADTAIALALPALMEKQAIKTEQDGIRVSIVKIDAVIHSNAVQCLMHAEKHGDTSLMRRLLVDIIDAKSGYRRQGVIAWMREFSPMELVGDVIKLTGTINGERRPWQITKANETHFTSLASAREMVPMKPIFKDNLTSKVERAAKEYRQSIENTLIVAGQPPKPKDVKKPFYDGIHLDKMDAAFDKIEAILAEVQSWNDTTKDARVAAEALKKAELGMADVKN